MILRQQILVLCAVLLTVSVGTANLRASEIPARSNISAEIDKHVAAGRKDFDKVASPRCSDAEFLRRIYLDLHGTIPSTTTVRAFLADTATGKRVQLVDELLDSPRFARRMADVFNVMLMERRPDVHVPGPEWHDYLRKSFLANKPLDQMALELLSADGTNLDTRPAAKFLLDRKLDIDLVTRDVGRVFLGRDMECAQCHDHPNVDDYLQRHYHGLAAFMKRSYIFNDPKLKKSVIAEKAEGDVSYTSVFTNESSKTNPRLLDLEELVDPDGTVKEYIAKPTSKVGGVPVYSRRLQLARAMLSEANKDFRRNWANRMWAIMMGRGLVEPVDLYHTDNPASHPKLIEYLSHEFSQSGFNVRWMLKQLALSDTYQRSSAATETKAKPEEFTHALFKPLTPEQMAWAIVESTGVREKRLEAVVAALLKSDPKFGKGRSTHPLWRDEALATDLKSQLNSLSVVFAPTSPGPEVGFDASADQALFMQNSASLQKLLKTGLVERLAKIESPEELANEAFVAVLSREPNEIESREISEYVQTSKDRRLACEDVIWALLTSAEFRFNH